MFLGANSATWYSGVATVAELQSELATIETQMAKPRSTQFADRSETQRSFDELNARKAQILTELARTSRRHRTFYARASKGFD